MSMAVPVVQVYDADDYEGEISRAVKTLLGGDVVVLPTETVYGAAGVLGDALAKLRAIRGGAENKPFTIHVPHRESAQRYIDPPNNYAQRLMRKLWPGPVGLMFDVSDARRALVARELGIEERDVYENGAITLRCPDHVVTTDVLSRVDRPVVMTVASNSPEAMAGKAELILDSGVTRYSKPSTLIRV
jgi:tRNA threonylcarbamoyl adenosine modification protein (Sua5/YciO/YrdC/YwlC family)